MENQHFTHRIGCLLLVATTAGVLGMGSTTAGAASSATQGHTASLNPRCLTLPAGNSETCPPGSPPVSAVSADGYATTPSGTVYLNGNVLPSGFTPAAPIVGVVGRPVLGTQYWLVGRDGGVFALGGAPFYGSMGGTRLNAPIVGMMTTPDGGGYWLVAADGGVFAFGDAPFYGSMGGTHLNAPIAGMAAGGNGVGYYLVGTDGGVFAFGNAPFLGSMGGTPLNGAVVGIYSTGNVVGTGGTVPGSGYFLIGRDGGIFAFGNASFSGSFIGASGSPVIGAIVIDGDCDPFGPIIPEPDVVASDGTVYGQVQGVC